MALRQTCRALLASGALLVGSTDPAPAPVPRQKSDPVPRTARQQPDEPAAAASPRALREEFAGDVVALDYPLAASDIGRLLTKGAIEVPDPEGGLLRITLRDVRYRHGTRVLRITSDGLPGVITQRGARFTATFATRRGTYNLSSHRAPDTARLIDQRQLDLRMDPRQPDYRHAPELAPSRV